MNTEDKNYQQDTTHDRVEKVLEVIDKASLEKASRRHEITKIRLEIARKALWFVLVSCILALGMALIIEDLEINIYTGFMYSMFGIVTLILGFIAGSGIDRD